MTGHSPVPAPPDLLADVPADLPPLARAVAMTRRVAIEGFDWSRTEDVLPVVRSEVDELLEAALGGDPARVQEEFGDLLFALANLSRHLGVDAPAALAGACDRFTTRFRLVEAQVHRSGRPMQEHSLEELDACWERAKAELAEGATCSRS